MRREAHAYSKENYALWFGEKERKYILKHYLKTPDRIIAEKLKIPKIMVKHYRRDVLGIVRLTGNQIGFNRKEPVEPKAPGNITEELLALKLFNYSGIMKESVENRIRLLEYKIRNGN